jgi:hypothetical protein
MAVPTFTYVPTEEDLMSASRQIDLTIAEGILRYSAEWSNGVKPKQIEIINHLVGMVNTLGKHCWHDIVWTYLVNKIHTLSNQINDNIAQDNNTHDKGTAARR